MANEPKQRRPGLGWPVAIVIGTIFLAGGFAGYRDAAAKAGDPTLPVWAGPLIAIVLGCGAMGLYLRRVGAFWRGWSPRMRRYWLALALSGMVGGIVGAWFILDQPAGNGPHDIIIGGALSHGFAIGASICWVIGLAVSMILYHRAIDDHEERAWLWAGLAGWYAFIFPAPVWWVLNRADLAPPVDAMPLFLLSMIVNAAVYLWLKFR